jgi:hypothetical protein
MVEMFIWWFLKKLMLLVDRKYTKEPRHPKVSNSVLSVFIYEMFIFQSMWKKLFYVPIHFSLFSILKDFFYDSHCFQDGANTQSSYLEYCNRIVAFTVSKIWKGQKRPTSIIVRFYFKSDFNGGFFFWFFMKFPASICQQELT